MNRLGTSVATIMLLTACGGSPPPPVATTTPPDTAARSAQPIDAPVTPLRRHWSNIGGGIGYSLQLEGSRGVLVECETGGYCTVYPIEQVTWSGADLTLTVRYPGAAQTWKASQRPEGRLQIEGGIWRAQTLFDCDDAWSDEQAPAYLCPVRLPLASIERSEGAGADRPAAEGPAPEYTGRLVPGSGAPDWRPITSWPKGVAGILWGQEANGADACAPVLEPPPDAEHGWSRFWTWSVYDRESLTEYVILHRILVWGSKTQSELSVVKRPALVAWQAGTPRFATTFMTYHPPAPRDIHSQFRIQTRVQQDTMQAGLQSRDLIDRSGEDVDFTYAMQRHRKGSPLQATEHVEMGIGRAGGTEIACRPADLGVLASQRYRMRDVSRGTDTYGSMGELLQRLVGG